MVWIHWPRPGSPCWAHNPPHAYHPVPARHRPVQVHHDAGGAPPAPRCPGAVPVQVPHARHRPGPLHRPDRRRDRPPVQPAFQRRGAGLHAWPALREARLRRFPRPVPPRPQVHPAARVEDRARRDRTDITGPWLHTILFEVPLLAIINEVWFRNTTTPDFAEGERRLQAKAALLRDTPVSNSAASPTTAAVAATRATGTRACCRCCAMHWARSWSAPATCTSPACTA